MQNKQFRADELNYYSVAIQMLKNLWVAVLIAAGAALCYIGIVRLTYAPKYISTATFMVGAKDSSNAYNSLTTTQSMAEVFAEVFQSNVLRDKVQDHLGDEKFTGVITTETLPETNLVTVSVTAPTPEMAFRSLSVIVEEYDTISDYLFSNAQLEVIKDPVVPMAPSNPLRLRRNAVIIAFLGGLLAMGAVLALCVLRDTIPSPEAARRKLDGRLLRTIHHEVRNKTLRLRRKKKNIAPLITAPLVSANFAQDNLSLSTAIEYHARKRGQKVILITSSGENEGKSTIAANLALSLVGRNYRVALLDCDFRKPSLHKVLEAPIPKEKRFSGHLLGAADGGITALVEHRPGLWLGTSNPIHKDIQTILRGGRLSRYIRTLRDQVDYVILDTPPMLAAADTEAIARIADTAVMVVRADFMATGAVNDCLDSLRQAAPDVAGLVLNNYRRSLR